MCHPIGYAWVGNQCIIHAGILTMNKKSEILIRSNFIEEIEESFLFL